MAKMTAQSTRFFTLGKEETFAVLCNTRVLEPMVKPPPERAKHLEKYKWKPGVKPPGAGRKPRAEELKLPNLIHDVIGDAGKAALIKEMYVRATKHHSYKHLELLMHYTYGKPTDKIKVISDDPNAHPYSPIIKVIADQMRLDKLEQDIADAGQIEEDTKTDMVEHGAYPLKIKADEEEGTNDRQQPASKSRRKPSNRKGAVGASKKRKR